MNQEEFLNSILTAEESQAIKRERILVALSGGADSVALLRILLATGYKCHAAHCNFHLRGEESMRDERFVRDLCQRLEVPLSVKDFDVAAWQQEHGGSVEMACRELRYAWFKQEVERLHCTRIAVAHHADDQVETFFINLLRGTGIKGLAGMQRENGYIWRPLLNVTRAQLLEYLDSISHDYVTDSTNSQNEYRRNRLRNVVLPSIEQEFPNAKAQIHKTMQNLASDFELLEWLVADQRLDLPYIDIEDVIDHPYADALLYHHLRELGFNRDQCRQAIEAAKNEHCGRQFASGKYLLVVNRKTFQVIEQYEEPWESEIPFDVTADTNSPINVKAYRGHTPFTPSMCCGGWRVAFNTPLLDCKRIILRHWRKGDRFQPFGMKGTKLVSDLFSDLKLDYYDKKRAWLLEADGEIIWVVGLRSSAHYTVPIGSQDYIILTNLIH